MCKNITRQIQTDGKNEVTKIRRLKEADLMQLAMLYKQFWGEDSSLKKMQATYQRLKANPNYIFLVAEIEDRVAGSAMGIVCEELYGDCKPFMVVEDVIVDEHQRRNGIGFSLMRELEKSAVKNNCSYIIFVTETERTEAHKFYESLDYKSDAYKGYKKRLTNSQQDA